MMPKPEHGEDGRHDVPGDAGVTERVDLSDRRFSTRSLSAIDLKNMAPQ